MANQSVTPDDIASLVRRELQVALHAHGKTGAITDTDALTATLGLSSSDIIALSARLSQQLQLSAPIRIDDVRTVADLCRACSRARREGLHSSAEINELDAVRQRAWARARRGQRPS